MTTFWCSLHSRRWLRDSCVILTRLRPTVQKLPEDHQVSVTAVSPSSSERHIWTVNSRCATHSLTHCIHGNTILPVSCKNKHLSTSEKPTFSWRNENFVSQTNQQKNKNTSVCLFLKSEVQERSCCLCFVHRIIKSNVSSLSDSGLSVEREQIESVWGVDTRSDFGLSLEISQTFVFGTWSSRFTRSQDSDPNQF